MEILFRVFKVSTLTENEYEEEEISLILSGSQKVNDWQKMVSLSIDQLLLTDINGWLP